ncbi:hypothetical protein ACJRO7_017618 [Eucalyptus globulus]|uniref:F-box associated domain-containing protein n=1 Tax=Eucalyptus globulus TaxID=34317 RepID=A0ABD3KV84_EUCGL
MTVGFFALGTRPQIKLFAPSVVNGCFIVWRLGSRERKTYCPCVHILSWSFNTENYEFHPGKVRESCQGHEKMHLLATKGHLYAYGTYAKTLDIWVLEDSANWYWVKKFNIYLEWDLKQYSIDDISIMNHRTTYQMKLIDTWKDEVLLVVLEKGPFRYHMRLKTITEAQFARPPPISLIGGNQTSKPYEVIAIERTMSLKSLGDILGSSQVVK